jgi:uncharacterized glyoxalase superfamily protein PhnB
MRAIANPTGSRLVPALRYHNVAAAVDWLCGAFGFERHDIVTAVDGTILHARLMFGSDMILLLPVRSPDGGTARAPEAAGEMQSCYFVIDDADTHYHHAKAAGAEILDITEYDYGGRGYSCRDPEGHLWTFGTYDPRQGQLAVIEHTPRPPSYWATMASDLRLRTVAGFRSLGDKITPPVVVAAVVASIIAAATVGWLMVALPQSGVDKRLTLRSNTAPAEPRTEEVAAQPPPAPSPVNTLSVRPVAPPQQAEETFARAVRQVRAPSRAPSPARVKSAAFAAVGGEEPAAAEEADDSAKEEAERKAEEALKNLRAAQRTAGQAFRQLREASAETEPAELPKQVARTAPDPRELAVAREQLTRDQQAREQRMARERKLAREKEAKGIEEQLARERAEKAAKEEAERARLSALAPAKAPTTASAPPEQKSDSAFWDCQPSAETGQVVCNPAARKPAAAQPEAKAPPAPKPKVTAAEPAKAPPARKPQDKKASGQLWDCQPKPPTGEVVCQPMAAKQ